MSFTRIKDAAVNVIRKLPNRPTGTGHMSAAALKAAFDQAAENIKEAFNNVLNEIEAATGAAQIGFQRSNAVPADTVQAAIENVQAQIAGVSQGAVANGSISTEKLAANSVTGDKVAEGALVENIAAEDVLELVSTTATEVRNFLEFRYIKALRLVLVSGSIQMPAASTGSLVAVYHFKDYLPYPSFLSGVFAPNKYDMLSFNYSTKSLTVSQSDITSDMIGTWREVQICGWYVCSGPEEA